MALGIDNYANTPFIQYAIHNEGIGGWAEVWKLNWTKGIGNDLGTMDYTDLPALVSGDQNQQNAEKSEKDIILVDGRQMLCCPEGCGHKRHPEYSR